MKQKNLLSFLGIIACLLLSIPVVGEETRKDNVAYIDANGQPQTANGVTEITNATEVVTWNAGWYVVKGEDVQLSKGAICQGAVHLILADGAKLTATGIDNNNISNTPGIQVSGDDNSLTIYGQEGQSGQLIANGGQFAAGIGGGCYKEGSNITINGGMVTATGGDGAAGIGGGDQSNGSNITINAGIVTATCGKYAAGIGGGFMGAGSNITISGGTVKANGGESASGIGNGYSCSTPAQNIFVATKYVVKAGDAETLIDKIENTGADLASSLAGKRYVVIVMPIALDYVDLGLPSGTLWASQNIGAENPEDVGNYYAWGEVAPKNTYSRGNYLLGNGDESVEHYPNFIRYTKNDGKTILEPQDDAAYINMGPRCHMPTADNYNELINNCTFQWITMGGQDGCLFTSKINGNVLFFPAGDYNPSDGQHCVYYWASTIGNADKGYADRFRCNPDETPNVGPTEWRFFGVPVRAVKLLKPFFSPEGCSFVDKMEVEIASVRKEAKIYFTLDGTTPTTKSTVYVKPITINTSVTVKAIAVLGNTTSEVASASYIKISEYVDLGLPSGNLWASHNIGATKPEDRGTKFCWGDIIYTGSTRYEDYKWRVEGGDYFEDYSKYNKEDGKTVLESQDDAAYMNLGPRWCMPTVEDFQELLDNCSSVYTSVGGENGWLFTSNVNGNGLFFPFAYYWASTIAPQIYNARYLDCYQNTSGAYIGWYKYRFTEGRVRAIIRPENINAYEGVYISGTPATTSYLAGSVFDVAGLDVYYVKEGAASTKVTQEATWTLNPAIIPVGCKSVTVTASYKGLTSTPIEVAITTDDFAPVFTPTAGSYEGIKAVTISCTDKNAKIYYTLDGSTPTTSSAQYTKPIIVGDAATIKAFVVNGDKQSNVMSASYTITQPDYVDLGLSSGLRWASKNVGAAKIEDYGKYYAWGDPTDKTNFSWGTYPYGSSVNNCIKYQKDDKWTLEPQDDAAYINWGPRWHTPTSTEIKELLNGCDTAFITYQGVYGLLLTSKTNGNSIFLPTAGNMDKTSLDHAGEGLYYWSSSVADMAYGNVSWLQNSGSGWSGYRQLGFSVRPVMDANKMSVTDGIYIKGQTHTTSCYAGDAFDLSKLNVYYIKEGGISENVTGSATLTASPSVIPVGCTSVTVTASYKGMQATSVKVTIATKVREIDLGLTKRWAEFNLGTCIPTEYGNYYTWSESLKSNDVAATLGSGWELPTREDVRELQDTTKCVWKWFEPGNTAYGGVAGYRVTGKRTGNSIFLPAAGTMSNSYFIGAGQVGNYWTSETGPQPLLDSYYMCFDRYDQCTGVDSQTNGKSVRAVKK